MPHECTNCGRTFPDGSKEMLSGCPDCGGNKFQFAPSGQVTTGSADSATATATDSAESTAVDPTDTGETATSTGTVERAAETVRGWVSSESKQPDQSDQPPQVDETAPSSRVDGNASATPSQSGNLDRSAETDRRDQPNRSWPASEETPETEQADDIEEFTEWPDTARRPEDRSTKPESDTDDSRRDHSPSGSTTAGQSAPKPDSGTASTSTPEPDSGTASTSTPEPGSETASTSTPEPDTDRSDSVTDQSIMADSENTAQADARTEVVSSDDLPGDMDQQRQDKTASVANHSPNPDDGEGDQPPDHGRVVSEPSDDQPSIEELRAELNEQFESIKIVSPGQYELNLMELYNREEYIISLQEDGRYVIDVPDSWHATEDE